MIILVDTHQGKEYLSEMLRSLRGAPAMKMTNDKVVVEISTEAYATLGALAYSFYSGDLVVEVKA